jgi:AAA15 family ATPase/GTPase
MPPGSPLLEAESMFPAKAASGSGKAALARTHPKTLRAPFSRGASARSWSACAPAPLWPGNRHGRKVEEFRPTPWGRISCPFELASRLETIRMNERKMLKSVHIKNFRGFRDLMIEPLKRVNLIIGQNNTGKTGVLEAMSLLLWEPSPVNCQDLPSLFRSAGQGDLNETFWTWLFYNKSLAQNTEIHASFDNKKEFELALQPKRGMALPHGTFQNVGTLGFATCYVSGGQNRHNAGFKPAIFSTHPSDPTKNAIEYNRVILKRRKKQVEEMLREIEPRLETLEALQTSQLAPLIYADLGLSEMIPVTQLGQGFNRLLDMYSEVVASDAKALLIDEIENGLHYSVLPVIWKGLFLAAKEVDVQIFATTHSWECVLAADQAAREGENYDLALIRLDRVKEDIKATVIDEKSLDMAKELHWEMR